MKIEAEWTYCQHPSKMATHVEHQMESCLSEMERLRGELQRLQTVKAEQEAAELEKTLPPVTVVFPVPENQRPLHSVFVAP